MSCKKDDIAKGQLADPAFFKKYKKVTLACCVVLLVSFAWYLNGRILFIQPQNNHSPIITLSIPDGKWHLSYTHSVQKTLVEEFFRFKDDNSLELYSTKYRSFGVGLPFLSTDGEFKLLDDGSMQMNLKRSFPVVKVWTGLEAKVKLVTAKQEINLYELYPPGTLLQISIQERYKKYIN